MKKAFTLVLIALATLCRAQSNFNTYAEHIAQDRMLLIFEPSVNAQQQNKLIQSSGLVSSFTHIPSPPLTICFVNDVNAAQKYFAGIQGVRFVSFFITDGKQHYAGVLNDFFVKLTDKNFEPLLQQQLKQQSLHPAVADYYIPNLYKVQVPAQSKLNTVDWCAYFMGLPYVQYASPDYLLNPETCSNDPLYPREWHIHNNGTPIQYSGTPGADMKVDTAWTISQGDSNIKVAVIDAGVDTLHEDLVQNILPGHDAFDTTAGYPTPDYPDDGHGTCCAGIIAGVKDNGIGGTGVAPLCKIIPVRVFYYVELSGNIIPFSTGGALADGVGWSWDTAHADILSNSWGLPSYLIEVLPGGTQPVTDAVEQAYIGGRGGKGVAMFFSSGNDDSSAGPIWPGNLAQAISVNATNMCDTRKSPTDCSHDAWGGTYGPGLTFSAPGEEITTTDMRGSYGFSTGDYYYTFSGTSASCPNAAAVGALVLSVRPQSTADDVRSIIAQTCDKVGGYNYDSTDINGTWCNELGHGRINAYRALLLAQNYSTIQSPVQDLSIKVFPNPADNELNILYSGSDKATMQLFDLTGRLLASAQLHMGDNREDISSLPGGQYLVRIDTDSGIATRKVTILR